MSNIVHIFGDSHCTTFVGADRKFHADVCGLDSASISGLNKTVSRLKYGQHIQSIVNHSSKSDYLLFKLGQVDIEFIMYFKFFIKGETFTFKEFCQSIVNNYREFINKILPLNPNIVIASINLPAYHSSVDIRTYIKRIISENLVLPDPTANFDTDLPESPLAEVDPALCTFTLEQLTNNFQYFNQQLSNLAQELNLLFFDTTPIFLDDLTQVLKSEFQFGGHHYNGYLDSKAKNITHNAFHEFFEKLQK